MEKGTTAPLNQAAQEALQETFGFDEFQAGQAAIISDVCAGHPTIAVMPTGAGKSLCYQLPAVLLDGLTIVVSPLISLMKDQVDSLVAKGIAAAFLNSSQDVDTQREVREGILQGEYDLVYVAPERFRSPVFMGHLKQVNIELLAVDEAHCISRWGHDFRPDYGRLGHVVTALNPRRLLACTATATPEVRDDIIRTLNLDSPSIHVAGFLRTNLHLSAHYCRKESERKTRLVQTLAKITEHEGGVIIYASTRRRVEQITQDCRDALPQLEVVSYHGGLADEERTRTQDAFMSGRARIAVATNAFGMGIDRADIRAVIHADLPRSVEAYYQEVGRAGRDGAPSQCIMLFNPTDRRTHEFLMDLNHPEAAWLHVVWAELRSQSTTGLSQSELAYRLRDDITTAQVESSLRALERIGAASSTMGNHWHPHPNAPSGVDDLGFNFQGSSARRARELHRLDLMGEYAFNNRCRHAQILVYFGEEMDDLACPGCDRCDDVTERYELDEEHLLTVKKALAGVARADGRFGLKKVAGMLAGSRSKDVMGSPLVHLSTFGLLKELRLDGCCRLLEAFLSRGLCYLSGGRYPLIKLSRSGWEVMQGHTQPCGLPPELFTQMKRRSRSDSKPEMVDDAWYSGLRAFRQKEAGRRSVPAYMVFSNQVLDELVERRPTTESAFLEVPGLGPGRWASYGERLVAKIEEMSAEIESVAVEGER